MKSIPVNQFLINHMAREHGRMGAWAREPKPWCPDCQLLGRRW